MDKRWMVAAFAMLLGVSAPAPVLRGAPAATSAPQDASVGELLRRDLIDGPGKEIVMLTVTYPAAGASLPHRHDAQVFVYVLEGEVRMQVQGGPIVTLRPGQTFYEAPSDVHVVSANTSTIAAAKLLVVMVKDKAAPGSRRVTD